MQRIKEQVNHLQQQLAGLTSAQKAFALALVGVMLAAAFIWTWHATTNDLVLLFDEPAPAADVARLQSALAARGFQAELHGQQLYIAERDRGAAIAALAYESLLPDDSNSALGEAIDKIGSFDARQKIEARLLQARSDALGRTIETFPGVASASVHLNPIYKKQIGQSLLPSASVSIATSGTADARKLALAVSSLLANSISALTPQRVTVVVDGRLVSATGDEELRSARELELRGEAESYFAQKVRGSLGSIPGLIVSVAVSTGPEHHELPQDQGGQAIKAGAAVAAAKSTSPAPVDRPLSLADVIGILSAPGSLGSEVSSGPAGEEALEVEVAFRDRSASAAPVPAGCSIIVPMTWIVQQWQVRNRTDEMPDPQVLAQFEDVKLNELRRVASACLGGLSQELVSVLVNADDVLLQDFEIAPGPAQGKDVPGISALISSYGREVAVAALAVVGVLLISSMLKKGGAASFQSQSLAISTDDFAHLGSLGGLPDDALASEQVVEHVQALVRQDPDSAAALVRGWLVA